MNLVQEKNVHFVMNRLKQLNICYLIVRMLNIFGIGKSTGYYTGTGNELTFSLQDKLFDLRGSNNYALNCILIVVRQMVYTCKIKTTARL